MDPKCLFYGMCVIILFSIIISAYFIKPFKYPHMVVYIDVSGKRKPVYEDFVDEWIIDIPDHYHGIEDKYDSALEHWDKDCERYLKRCILWRSHRRKIYENMRQEVLQHDYDMFEFVFYRNQTRYHQHSYQKQAYTVQNADHTIGLSLREMIEINDELREIDYETTRTKWCSKNQRKLMTKELKDRIKRRDNYTCQICGKYMPDEVGLHVDHIVSIKKGGKSVETNLQVLCDKCNLRKGSKI